MERLGDSRKSSLTDSYRLIIGVVLFTFGAIIATMGLTNVATTYLQGFNLQAGSAFSTGISIGGIMFALLMTGVTIYVTDNRQVKLVATMGGGVVVLGSLLLVNTEPTTLRFSNYGYRIVLFGIGVAGLLTSLGLAGLEKVDISTNQTMETPAQYYTRKPRNHSLPTDGEGDEGEELDFLLDEEDEEGESRGGK